MAQECQWLLVTFIIYITLDSFHFHILCHVSQRASSSALRSHSIDVAILYYHRVVYQSGWKNIPEHVSLFPLIVYFYIQLWNIHLKRSLILVRIARHVKYLLSPTPAILCTVGFITKDICIMTVSLTLNFSKNPCWGNVYVKWKCQSA